MPSKERSIEAEVLAIGEDYLLVTTEDDIDYVVNTKDLDYKVGDSLKIDLKDIDEDKMPIEATAKNITILTEIENNTNKVEDDQEDKVVPPEDTQETKENNNSTQTTTPTQNTPTVQEYSEEEIISYFDDLDVQITNYNNNDSTLGQTIKSKFVKCIDFIFYGDTIGGKTFNELTNTAKLKIIKIALSIDSKIDSKFPRYKDSISSTYQNIKTKLIEKYLDITTTICNNDPELCINAKEGFKDLKSSFGLTWDIIKDLAGKGTTKLKNWYEIWRYN